VYDGGSTGSQTDLDHEYLPVRTLTWFDRYLRGLRVDTGPAFTWFRDYVANPGRPRAGAAWGTASAYPAMGGTTYLLSGSDALVPTGGPVTAGAPSFTDTGVPTSFSETSNFQAAGSTLPLPSPANLPFDTSPVAPSDAPGTAVSFTGPAFTVDTESVGAPTVHLQLSHVNPVNDLVFFGKVFDIAPDGTAALIHRLIAPVRVPAAQLSSPVDAHLLGFAHLFKAGHQVRLVLAATDATSPQAAHPDVITVTTGSSDPSWFSLPARVFHPDAAPESKPGRTGTQPPRMRPVVRAPQRSLAATGLDGGVPAVAAALLLLGAVARRRRHSGLYARGEPHERPRSRLR
jgi:ABC-2 type transport system ATP-binding protein